MAKKKTKILGRDDILGADDRSVVEVSVPEWGGAVYMRPPSSIDLESFGDKPSVADMLVRVLTDADGQLLFEPDDVVGLMQKNVNIMNRLGSKFLEISGLSVEDQEA